MNKTMKGPIFKDFHWALSYLQGEPVTAKEARAQDVRDQNALRELFTKAHDLSPQITAQLVDEVADLKGGRLPRPEGWPPEKYLVKVQQLMSASAKLSPKLLAQLKEINEMLSRLVEARRRRDAAFAQLLALAWEDPELILVKEHEDAPYRWFTRNDIARRNWVLLPTYDGFMATRTDRRRLLRSQMTTSSSDGRVYLARVEVSKLQTHREPAYFANVTDEQLEVWVRTNWAQLMDLKEGAKVEQLTARFGRVKDARARLRRAIANLPDDERPKRGRKPG